MSASSPGSDGGGMSIREDPGSSPDIRPAPGHRAENAGLLGSAGLPTVGRIRPEGPSCNPTPAWRLEWSAAPARVTALRWRDGGGAVSRPQGWASLRNSRLLHVTAGRPPGGKTPLFRHWRKCCQHSLVRGWRKRYRRIRWPVPYSKLRARAGLRYKQTKPRAFATCPHSTTRTITSRCWTSAASVSAKL